MNILGNGGTPPTMGGLSPQMMQNIQQVKGLMGMMKGNPMALLQQNPQMAQVMQMCNGKNPQAVFEAMCKERGIDANAFMSALKN